MRRLTIALPENIYLALRMKALQEGIPAQTLLARLIARGLNVPMPQQEGGEKE